MVRTLDHREEKQPNCTDKESKYCNSEDKQIKLRIIYRKSSLIFGFTSSELLNFQTWTETPFFGGDFVSCRYRLF